VHARFLLGPAGSGKTFRCLEEIRTALRDDPSGPPLIFLAPKQATFQLERQLLGDAGLAGYTRLYILSFQRLAEFILRELRRPAPPLLSEEGRVMVLRALLSRHRASLQIFHGSAGLAGFARKLSLELRELQRRRLSSAALSALASRPDLSEPLRRKLQDLSLLQRAYLEWLAQRNLQDADCLLDLAASAFDSTKTTTRPISIAGIWLDGFGELAPQELGLLAALAPCCDRMTLAFCVDAERPAGAESWLSIWSAISGARDECGRKFSSVPGVTLETEILRRRVRPGRFDDRPVLRHLEESWATPAAFPEKLALNSNLGDSVRAAICANPEAEAVLAAREILQFVRAGGRFRDAAVLVRSMEGYHDVLRRVFSRYEIPFFLDRREPASRHPLAELTRNALRLVAFDWRHDDWFSALKTGLVSGDEEAIDRLENEALARGWNGATWTSPFVKANGLTADAEMLRQQWVAPFLRFREELSFEGRMLPDGPRLAAALRELWHRLQIEDSLAEIHAESSDSGVQFHLTVWQQMNDWLDNVALAFPGEFLPLTEWLTLFEAGLAGITVGVIPPALDQVLIGAVDRSRNPDLQLAIVLGVNESVFPAPPPPRHLLTDSDCEELSERGLTVADPFRRVLGRERFLGYIACTRARRRLVVICARYDAGDNPLNPSPFFSHLKQLFPQLEVEEDGASPLAPLHISELFPQVLRLQTAGIMPDGLLDLPAFAPLRQLLRNGTVVVDSGKLSPALAERLYGPALRTSVSRLEQFAACSFRFFVHSGLQAEERVRFELDARRKGSFQHLALSLFHEQLRKEGKTWHDLDAADARQRIAEICAVLIPQFDEGLLAANPLSRFAARGMARSLEDFVAAMAEWMHQYDFEPTAVELEFGGDPQTGSLPAWELDLGSGHRLIFRGRIDRVDLFVSGPEALVVVVDYKSSQHKLDPVYLRHGLQLQLPAYLSVLRRLASPGKYFDSARLVPAGVFYINLRGKFEHGENRNEVLLSEEPAWQAAYQHAGRFDLAALPHLDNRGASRGTQFNYRLKADGRPAANTPDAMDHAGFQQMLDQVEENLIRMGRAIFAGEIAPNPFQKGTIRACDRCEYQGVCRIDPWAHAFRLV